MKLKFIIYASIVCLLFSCKLKDAFSDYAEEPIDKLDSGEKMIEFVRTNTEISFDSINKPISTILMNDCESKHRKEFFGTEFYVTSENMMSILNVVNNSKSKSIKLNEEYCSDSFKTILITDDKNSSLQVDLDLRLNKVTLNK